MRFLKSMFNKMFYHPYSNNLLQDFSKDTDTKKREHNNDTN